MLVRPATDEDRAWIAQFLADHCAAQVARRGERVSPEDHPMLIAELGGSPAGLLTYIFSGGECEILTLHAVTRWRGAGSALVEAVSAVALKAGCRALWVLTPKDNVEALRFYQRRGFRLRTVRPGATDEARRELKPEIPAIGDHGIPLRDEIELEQELAR